MDTVRALLRAGARDSLKKGMGASQPSEVSSSFTLLSTKCLN